jgi:hypothetical protein
MRGMANEHGSKTSEAKAKKQGNVAKQKKKKKKIKTLGSNNSSKTFAPILGHLVSLLPENHVQVVNNSKVILRA